MRSRKALAIEVTVAVLLGLAPSAIRSAMGAMSGSLPDFVIRALYVLAFVTGPGYFVGAALAGLVAGLFSIDSISLDRVMDGCGVLVNVAAFGALWFMLRTGSRVSLRWKLAVALLVVWGAFSIPMGVFGSMWMSL